MIYIDENSDFEPVGFTAFADQYTVFIDDSLPLDEDFKNVIGTANILLDNISSNYTRFYINYIETYRDGCNKIINYLMNLYPNGVIAGESYVDTMGFWSKMGATFSEEDIEDSSELVYFELTKEAFMQTKYYSI